MSEKERTVIDKAKEKFYSYGQSLGIKINDLQRLMSLAKEAANQLREKENNGDNTLKNK